MNTPKIQDATLSPNPIKNKPGRDRKALQGDIKVIHERVIGTSPVGHTLSRAVPVKIDLV